MAGKPLPFSPYCCRHPEFFRKTYSTARQYGDRDRAMEMFSKMAETVPLTEDMMIKIERIRGHIVLIGAEDDVLWDTSSCIRRMDRRLSEREHECTCGTHIYEHCTHFVLSEGMLNKAFPGAGTLMTKIMFQAGKDHPEGYRASRKDIDGVITSAIARWIAD